MESKDIEGILYSQVKYLETKCKLIKKLHRLRQSNDVIIELIKKGTKNSLKNATSQLKYQEGAVREILRML